VMYSLAAISFVGDAAADQRRQRPVLLGPALGPTTAINATDPRAKSTIRPAR
jgi:hypothetical protein